MCRLLCGIGGIPAAVVSWGIAAQAEISTEWPTLPPTGSGPLASPALTEADSVASLSLSPSLSPPAGLADWREARAAAEPEVIELIDIFLLLYDMPSGTASRYAAEIGRASSRERVCQYV